jgi:hypothetical protein
VYLRTLALAFAIAAPVAAPALAQPMSRERDCARFEDYRCIHDVHMRRGTDTIVYRGVLTPDHPGYSYRFKARAGQVLTIKFLGPASRKVIGYPNGDSDGPGIPDRIELKQTGLYTLEVSANTMAEGAFGPFTLTLIIR